MSWQGRKAAGFLITLLQQGSEASPDMCHESPQPAALYGMCFPNSLGCAGVCDKARRHELGKQVTLCDEPGLTLEKAVGS